jgi:hypothetical protein
MIRPKKHLNSFLFTIGILAGMAVYLVCGKYYGGSLDPRAMLSFAGLLAVQGGVAMAGRMRLLLAGEPVAVPVWMESQGVKFHGQLADAAKLLAVLGVLPLKAQNPGNLLCYGKMVRLSVMAEVVAYAGLLLALVCGGINYGLGMRGYAMVSPSTAWVELESNIQMVQEGFMADKAALDYRMKITDLRHEAGGKGAQVRFEMAGREGAKARSYVLSRGDSVDMGKIRLRFIGDTYMVFSYATKGDLDYQVEPIYLHRQETGSEILYCGALKMNQPGGSGEMTYDPETGRFRIMFHDRGRIALDRTVAQGEVARQGEYAAQVTGLGHFARIDIWRHSNRNQIFAGLIIMAGAFAMRLFCRPLKVWLWTADGGTFFFTRNRRLRKLLATPAAGG